MNQIALDLKFVQIYWYSIFIFLAIMIGAILFFKEAKKNKLKEEFLVNLVFYAVVFGIIGARLYYCLFNLDYYIHSPIEILKIWEGGLAIHGGIIAGAIWIIYYSKKHKINFLKVFDIVAPSLLIAQAIGRWGNFFNQEAHGPEVAKSVLENLHLPKFIIEGMNIDGVYYHPTFLYESVWNLIGFAILIYLRKKKKLRIGTLTGIYFMWYSLARFFIESLRTDSLMLGPLKIAQVVSILLFALGAYLVFHKEKDTRVNRYKERDVTNEN